jgi:hypothetical protein
MVAVALAPANAAIAQTSGADALLLDDVGAGWQPAACSFTFPGESQHCFASTSSAATLTDSVVEVPAGFEPRAYMHLLTGEITSVPFSTNTLDAARGWVLVDDPITPALKLMVASTHHVFEFILIGAAGDPIDPTGFLLDLGGRQQKQAGGPPRVRPRTSSEAEVDRLFATVPPRWGLTAVPVSLRTDFEALRGDARNQRVIDVLEHDDVNRVRAFSSPDLSVVISLDRTPYGLFAAVALGAQTHGAQPTSPPGLETIRDGFTVEKPGQVFVTFRRGPYLVTVAVAGDPAGDRAVLERRAATIARRQERLIPPGATAPYFFPSTGRAIVTVILLTTAACIVAVGLGRLRARRCRRDLRIGHRPDALSAQPATVAGSPAHEAAVDVSPDATRLRRMGLALVTVQIAALNLIVIGVLGLLGVLDTLSRPTSILLVAAGLLVALGFTRWQRHRELNAIRPAVVGRAWRPAGVAAATAALTLLVVGVAVATSGVADLAFGPGLRTLERANGLNIDPSKFSTAMAATGLMLVIVGGVAFRFGRMWSRADARRLREHDRRPSVLYLRSFEDDDLSIPTVLSARRPFFELFRLRGTDTFEEAIAWELSPYGPVVAVGRPGRPLASLGAAREYLPQEHWRDGVTERMGEAAAIVMVIGATEGLQWELGEVVKAGHIAKTIFVFPPVSEQTLHDRWTFTADALETAGVAPASLHVDTDTVCTAILGRDGAWRVTVADVPDEATYRVAIDRSMEIAHLATTATALTNR